MQAHFAMELGLHPQQQERKANLKDDVKHRHVLWQSLLVVHLCVSEHLHNTNNWLVHCVQKANALLSNKAEL